MVAFPTSALSPHFKLTLMNRARGLVRLTIEILTVEASLFRMRKKNHWISPFALVSLRTHKSNQWLSRTLTCSRFAHSKSASNLTVAPGSYSGFLAAVLGVTLYVIAFWKGGGRAVRGLLTKVSFGCCLTVPTSCFTFETYRARPKIYCLFKMIGFGKVHLTQS